MKRLRWIIAGSFLRAMRTTMQRRLDAGDLDFDDTVYRSMEAADTLLEVWFERGSK